MAQDIVKYVFWPVILWAKDGAVNQIGVIKGYRGYLAKRVKIGSTIEDVQAVLGRVIEDDEDKLVMKDVPGLFFETEVWLHARVWTKLV
jgi:hypothetical protein